MKLSVFVVLWLGKNKILKFFQHTHLFVAFISQHYFEISWNLCCDVPVESQSNFNFQVSLVSFYIFRQNPANICVFFQLSGTVEANFWCEKIVKLSGHDMLQFFIMFYFFKQSILLFVRVICS